MPRYYFDRTDGTSDPDFEGLELSGLDEAKHEAIHFAADTLKDLSLTDWRGGEVQIEVADSKKKLLFIISISAVNVAEQDAKVQA